MATYAVWDDPNYVWDDERVTWDGQIVSITGVQVAESDAASAGSITGHYRAAGTQITQTNIANAGGHTSAESEQGARATESDLARAGKRSATVTGTVGIHTNIANGGAPRIAKPGTAASHGTAAFAGAATQGQTGTTAVETDNPALGVVSTQAYEGPFQWLRPRGDLAVAGWTNQAGSTENLYAAISEGTADDADYITVSA